MFLKKEKKVNVYFLSTKLKGKIEVIFREDAESWTNAITFSRESLEERVRSQQFLFYLFILLVSAATVAGATNAILDTLLSRVEMEFLVQWTDLKLIKVACKSNYTTIRTLFHCV